MDEKQNETYGLWVTELNRNNMVEKLKKKKRNKLNSIILKINVFVG